LDRQLSDLVRFAGPAASLQSRLPEVLGNPRTAELLTRIAGGLHRIGPADQRVLTSVVRDLLLAASLVPGRPRQVIETITPGELTLLLTRIARLVHDGLNPIGQLPFLALTRYQPGLPHEVRWTLLAVLPLPEGAQDRKST